MSIESAKLEIKEQVGRLLGEYAELTNVERLESDQKTDVDAHEPVGLVSWVVVMEFVSTSMMREDESATLWMRPEGQPRSSSRGLLEMGAEAFHV